MKIVMEINLENTPWCSGKLGQVNESLCVWSIFYDESKYVDQE